MATTAWTAPPCITLPPPIEDVRVGAGATVDLSWSGLPGIARYRVYRYRTPDRSDTPVVLRTGVPFLADDVLNDGVNYSCDVRGVNACGESPR
jgi:hypothetical protein